MAGVDTEENKETSSPAGNRATILGLLACTLVIMLSYLGSFNNKEKKWKVNSLRVFTQQGLCTRSACGFSEMIAACMQPSAHRPMYVCRYMQPQKRDVPARRESAYTTWIACGLQ
jgi:hypothetical protein